MGTEDNKEEKEEEEVTIGTSVLQFSFIKSALTVNPCMVRIQTRLKRGICQVLIHIYVGISLNRFIFLFFFTAGA